MAVSARGSAVHPAASSTVGPIVIGILAGLAAALFTLVVVALIRRQWTRRRSMESIRRLFNDVDAARRDPVLVHQARRRIRSTGLGGHERGSVPSG